MAAQRVGKTLFAKFLTGRAEGFGDAVGVENENVTGGEAAFRKAALPILEGTQDGGGSREALKGVV